MSPEVVHSARRVGVYELDCALASVRATAAAGSRGVRNEQAPVRVGALQITPERGGRSHARALQHLASSFAQPFVKLLAFPGVVLGFVFSHHVTHDKLHQSGLHQLHAVT